MNITQNILTQNDCYKAQRYITPKGIMVHSTGCNQPKIAAYTNNWNKSGVQKCVHGFIGKDANGNITIVQTLPWNMRAWHCGTGTSGTSANNTHISFEICEDNLTDATYFNEVYTLAVELCAYLCKMYSLTADDIICHCEGYDLGIASNHADVMHWFPKYSKSMDTFRADVANLLNSQTTSTTEEDDDMTQDKFNEMMTAYLEQLSDKEPSDWSETARSWAESNGIIAGDQNGNKQYKNFCTREQMVQFLYRMSQK
jgi:N-acetylmuramoyl-L-alanine amidase